MSDVICLDNHRLLCGDAENKEDVLRLLDGAKVDLLLTDPPYGIDIVKVGGGKLADKEGQQLDHSREREREREQMASIGGSKPPSFKRNSGNTCKTRLPQGERVYGKVGKPRRCRSKTIQTSSR